MKSGCICGLCVLFNLPCRRLRGRFGTWVWLLGYNLVVGAGNFQVSAADQPQWGQAWSRNMVSEEKHLPDSFDPKTGRNVKWTAQLGTETHSTPIRRGRAHLYRHQQRHAARSEASR